MSMLEICPFRKLCPSRKCVQIGNFVCLCSSCRKYGHRKCGHRKYRPRKKSRRRFFKLRSIIISGPFNLLHSASFLPFFSSYRLQLMYTTQNRARKKLLRKQILIFLCLAVFIEKQTTSIRAQ